MTTRFLPSSERIDIVTETVNVVQCTRGQESVNLGEIAKGRSGQCILTIKRPGKFAGIERNGHFVLHWRKERLRQVIVGATLRIEGTKKPKLVLNNRAADVAAEIHFGEPIGRGTREREVLHLANQALG